MARRLRVYPSVSISPENLKGDIDFVRVFGRCGPVHIEIGSGKGTFLVSQGKTQVEVNFLGIEWARKYYRFAVDRIGRWGLANVRMIRTEALGFLTEFVPDESVDCFHIYFPDPWPKKRHHKRRLFNPANLEQMLRCLKPGGIIKLATDYEEYFEQMQQVLEESNGKFEEIEFEPTAGAGEGEIVGTNYERKYLEEQRRIYTIAIKKK
ncbi:MAG: tRNA (guanosine(46)-N7)-methyltransferase TrmB [Planctomycetota bacterium]|jgi:tRNA (guanine-N7-)-methyltransferase